MRTKLPHPPWKTGSPASQVTQPKAQFEQPVSILDGARSRGELPRIWKSRRAICRFNGDRSASSPLCAPLRSLCLCVILFSLLTFFARCGGFAFL